MRMKIAIPLIAAAVLSLCTHAYSLIGAGLHYGIDNSIGMDDAIIFQEPVALLSEPLPFSISGESIEIATSFPLMYVTRFNFERTPINFGGKIFLDALPLVDGVEVSMNFGVWQYSGAVRFFDFATFTDLDQTGIQGVLENPNEQDYYAEQELTLEALDISYWGMKKTPYARLHVDLNVRKNVVKFPPVVNILKVYAGGGLSMNFSTPVLSAKLIEDVLAKQHDLDVAFFQNLSDLENPEAIWGDVLGKITDGLAKPVIGMNVMAGVQLKLPVVPVGLYADAKVLIPFASLDEYVEVGGIGFLLNTGISLSF